VRTANSNHSHPVFPNLIKDLVIKGINQVWVADITYIHILTAFVYLAVVLDLHSRKVIGYSLSKDIDPPQLYGWPQRGENRPQDAFTIRIKGVQYASSDYVKELQAYSFKISMARRGNPYDNATCESFIETLKTEKVYLWEYKTIEDAETRICHFIQDVYNERRLQSSLRYRPPQ